MKQIEIKPKEKPRPEEKLEIRINGEVIQPDKWYGTCYGIDLEDEIGKNYR